MGELTELTRRPGKQVQNKTEKSDSLESTQYNQFNSFISVSIQEWMSSNFIFIFKKNLFKIHVSRREHVPGLTWSTYTFPSKGKKENLFNNTANTLQRREDNPP